MAILSRVIPPRAILSVLVFSGLLSMASAQAPLSGTQPLTADGDLSAQMVAGIDRWLDRENARLKDERHRSWLATDPLDWPGRRAKLHEILGTVADPQAQGEVEEFLVVGEAEAWTASGLRWPVLEGVWGEGLLLRPRKEVRVVVVAVPDADQTPEQLAGLTTGIPAESQFARRLADQGCLVLIPRLVNRHDRFSGNPRLEKLTNQPHREWLYRQGFEMGRTLIGLEAAKILRGLEWLHGLGLGKVGLFGYGEGGLIALQAAPFAIVDATLISGYFGPRDRLWSEPIYRNAQGYLRVFDDAVLAAQINPGRVLVEHSTAPEISGPPAVKPGRKGAAPGTIRTPALAEVEAEVRRANELREHVRPNHPALLIKDPSGAPLKPGSEPALRAFLAALDLPDAPLVSPKAPELSEPYPEIENPRQQRTVSELETFLQRTLVRSENLRNTTDLWKKLASGPSWKEVQGAARAKFWKDVIGQISTDYLPPNPRTRQIIDREKWTGYEVMLDVHPDISAWGTLLLPKDLKPGERRPVVVCQHGLEGLPSDTYEEDQTRAWASYKAFAARLAERGFVVYAPHNPYRGGDAFRTLQRKANPLGLSLFSFIIAQHDVTTRWLAALPFVDPERIAFYGLSYGGKTAMRVPAALERYCLSICSGDFNEWVRKNASVDYPSSYLFSGEYEIFEWDLAHTFNYAEMALLIAPRPFMVEYGHRDGVARSEWVGYEFAKVLRGYTQLGIPERAQIEWFDGPHTIHGQGTFQFLHTHLRWPSPP